MNKKNILLVAGAIIAGTAFYYGRKAWLKRKKEKEDASSNTDTTVPGSETSTTTPSTTGGSTGSTTTPVSSNPFKTKDEVKAFQDWMDKQGKPWIKPVAPDTKWKFLRVGTPNVNGAGYGNWGANTSTAWNLFGKDYLTSGVQSGSGSTPSNTGTTEQDTQAINTAGLGVMYQILTTGNAGKFTPYATQYVAGARPYLKVVVNNSEFYIFADKTFGIWNKTTGSWTMKGTWSITGTTTIVQSVYNFSTFSQRLNKTSVNPLVAMTSAQQSGLSNDKSAFLAEKLKNAMSGAGTDMPSFKDAMFGIRNRRQYSQVYEAFGVKEGQNLDQWINGDLRELQERKYWNNNYVAVTGLQLNTSSITIKEASTTIPKVNFPF
jgi:hypothetical protein